jgi:hypothetical protein
VQAPVPSQAVAPQIASVVEQALAQQFPVPSVPQTADWQLELLVHRLPSASRPPVLVPPLVAPPGPPVVPGLIPVVAPVLVPPVVPTPADVELPLDVVTPPELPVVAPEAPSQAVAKRVRPTTATRKLRTWKLAWSGTGDSRYESPVSRRRGDR